MLDEAAQAVIGRALQLPETAVQESLDPIRSVEGRTVRGGPAKPAVLALVAEGRERLAVDRQGLEARQKLLADARATLKREIAVLAGVSK